LPAAARARAGGSAGELVGGVERRDLVALGERRVVEDRLQEVVEPAAEADDRLTNVDQLRRSAADGVDAQQLAAVSMKEHLEEAAVIAQDLTARDLVVACDAGLVRYLLPRQLLLGGAHHRDLGNRVDADGKMTRHRPRRDAEGVTRGQPALLARGGSQARVPDDV